jgi:hypothetical protein
MFQCTQCHQGLLLRDLRFYQGDWIIPCCLCGAKNVLGLIRNNAVPLSNWEVIGWRE